MRCISQAQVTVAPNRCPAYAPYIHGLGKSLQVRDDSSGVPAGSRRSRVIPMHDHASDFGLLAACL